MNKEEIEAIKKMVVHGIYEVCLMNNYDVATFNKFKNKQDLLFDNYISNKTLIDEFNNLKR